MGVIQFIRRFSTPSESSKSPVKQALAVLIFAALLAPALALILTTQGGIVSSPILVAGENSPENSPTNIFGNPDLPDWKDVAVEDTADFIVVNNADNLFFKFRKGTAGYNEIWQNDVQIVADERWVIEYLFNAPDTWKTRGIPQYVEWEQPENYHVVVKRYYRDWGEPETTFWVIYDFYGGFRPKISVEMEVGQEDNYRIAWRASGINKTHVAENFNYVRFWNENEEAIVFDYSDVYETFDNITKVEIEPKANDHKLNEYFYVGNLGIGDFRLDPNFGYETEGSITSEFEKNAIIGSYFQISEDGTADSISVYLAAWSDAYYGNAKAAIYDSDNALVGSTDENYIDSDAFHWKQFSFSTSPDLTGGNYYWLVVWTADHTYIAKETPSAYILGEDSETYNSFPNPWAPSITEFKVVSIFCTYSTEAAAPGKPVLVSPENNHSTSDNTPTFVWENGSDATSHRLVIDNSQGFDDGDNIYDNAGAWDNSGTAIENELLVDNYWWKVAGVANSTENWSENTWTFEVVPRAWNLIETWTGTVEAPVAWQLIETWTGTIGAPVAWQLIETWDGTVEAYSGWVLLETWGGTVEAFAAWNLVETWTGTITAPVAWELIETWEGTVEAFVSWQLIETWSGTVQAPAGWLLAESWSGTIEAFAEWHEIESWTGTVRGIGWMLVETWDGTVHGVGWRLIETWSGSVETPAVYAVIISITPDNQSGTLGDTLTYTVIVVNIGAQPDNYDLTSSDAQGWTTYLDNDNFIDVPSGENRETTLNVGLSTTGTHEVIVTATGTGVSDSDNCTAISATAPDIVQIGDGNLALAIGLMAIGLAVCMPFIAVILIRRRREEEGTT